MCRCSEVGTDHESKIDADASPNASTITIANFYSVAVSDASARSDSDRISYSIAVAGGITDTGSDAEIFSGPESFSR